MKIAFLTNCLEPGRDGVGDYTTRLAAECERRGHATRRLALHDPHIECIQTDGTALRMPAALPWPERMEKAKSFLAAFKPDFVSLQFVCYGFHPRGIDFTLGSKLRAITGGFPVQIMLHELWIGAETGAPAKARLFGFLQRRCLLDVVKKLRPCAVHTSNLAYVTLLRGRGVIASLLPLFGSIPLPPVGLPARERDDPLVFVFFGALHPVWPPEPLFSLLRALERKIVFAHIGRLGPGETLWEKLPADYGKIFEFRRLGVQSPEKIAEFFRTGADFGIATTPWALIGKSATVAAMLEHGLPVIVNRDDVHYAGWREEEGTSQLISMDENLPERIRMAKRLPPRSILPDVAAQFLNDVERAL